MNSIQIQSSRDVVKPDGTEKAKGMHSAHLRQTDKKRREATLQFPRSKKGSFERTAARAPDRKNYRKDFIKKK